jgi:hypothetical protein
MTDLNRFLPHAIVLGLALALTLPARALLKERHRQERRKIEAEGRNQRMQELAARWSALPFTPIGKPNFCELLVASADWATLGLTDVQRTKLRQRLQEIFAYLHNPTFEEYWRLKTEGLHQQFELGKSARVLLQGSGLLNEDIEQRDPRDIGRLVWDAAATWREAAAPSRLMAACVENAGIVVNRSNSPNDILGGKVSKGLTAAHTAFDPGFRYGAPGGIAPEDFFLHLSFIARSNASEYAAPIHISLHWSDRDQNWALSRMFTDALLRMNNLF